MPYSFELSPNLHPFPFILSLFLFSHWEENKCIRLPLLSTHPPLSTFCNFFAPSSPIPSSICVMQAILVVMQFWSGTREPLCYFVNWKAEEKPSWQKRSKKKHCMLHEAKCSEMVRGIDSLCLQNKITDKLWISIKCNCSTI